MDLIKVSNVGLLVLACGTGLVGGCVKSVMIVPVDPQHSVLTNARVSADGHDVGVGPSPVDVRGPTQVEVNNGDEWLRGHASLNDASPDRLEVLLQPDAAFRETVADQSNIVNTWITLNIASPRRNTWWSTIVAAISGAEFEPEMMDQASGFLRTAWRIHRYEGIAIKIRERVTGNIVTQDPLTWRIRYEVERCETDCDSASPNFRPWQGRGFQSAMNVISEIRARTQQ